ncbi:hypothetical protein OS493_022254 [Desmophyllum pertusum]|uniref:Mab-21-like HhH/H2TH-like domain-containing protein n=1 Tax=Desmophyllum pertusum TaxID=174260 RepID=A0A9X0CE74_9CNID|nr:hypothetical protein OS493_022254 [Desmophyllum pertusum]
MAAEGHGVNYQELNSIFKSLGERGEEAQVWKEYNEHVFSFVLELVSQHLSKTTENCLKVRPYGSAAEDLKCIAHDDFGDVDIMLFPTSDNTMIYEELLEYSPENRLHVRIKGSDHPVLQSCLVKDTEYVATSALKDFHPAIYGSSSPELIDRIVQMLRMLSREDLTVFPQCMISWKNKKTSPAFTVDVKQSFITMLEELKKMEESQCLQHLDVAEWEWLAHSIHIARGSEYAKEYAEVMDDLFQYICGLQAKLTEAGPIGILQGFPGYCQEPRDTSENHNADESGSRMGEAASHDQPRDRPENRDADESGSSTKSPNDVSRPNRNDASSFDSQERNSHLSEEPMAKQVIESEDADGKTKDATDQDGNKDPIESKPELKTSTEKVKLTSEDVPLKEDHKEEDEKRKIASKHVYEHILGTGTEMKDYPGIAKEYKRKGGMDFVPALRSGGWPKVARDWNKRERKWPSPEMVDKVIQEGYHLVVKPPKKSASPDCDFRISFSHAEYLLSQEMNDIHRECYRCLKKFHRAHLSKPAGLITFHLKNMFLQTIEETGAELWTESNRAMCMMKLLGNLLEALTKKDLRHYFARSYNLFGVDYIEDHEILEPLADEVKKIMDNPIGISKELIQLQVENEECHSSSEPALPAKPASEHAHGGTDENRSSSSSDSHSKEEVSTVPVLKTETAQGGSPTTSYRYHDLKDIYLQVSRELVDMAFNDADCSLEALDPLEKSLVEDLRELARVHGGKVEDYVKMFETCWELSYYKVWISTESDTRRRMLLAIQGDVEIFKYIGKQEDLAPGNEDAIANRMRDPSIDDPFDLNHVFPAGIGAQICRRWLKRS